MFVNKKRFQTLNQTADIVCTLFNGVIITSVAALTYSATAKSIAISVVSLTDIPPINSHMILKEKNNKNKKQNTDNLTLFIINNTPANAYIFNIIYLYCCIYLYYVNYVNISLTFVVSIFCCCCWLLYIYLIYIYRIFIVEVVSFQRVVSKRNVLHLYMYIKVHTHKYTIYNY